MLYTTNAVESLNLQLRKVLRNRGPFPNDDAVKVLLLAIQNAKSRWNASKNWNQALSQLDIFFEGRLPASVNLHRNSDTLAFGNRRRRGDIARPDSIARARSR